VNVVEIVVYTKLVYLAEKPSTFITGVVIHTFSYFVEHVVTKTIPITKPLLHERIQERQVFLPIIMNEQLLDFRDMFTVVVLQQC